MNKKLSSFAPLFLTCTLLVSPICKRTDAQLKSYTLTDLLALESEKNTEEFFLHYRDLRPSERQKQWREITLNMGNIWLTKLVDGKKYDRGTFQVLEERSDLFPFKDDELFQFNKRKYLTGYFDNCYLRNSPLCSEDLAKSLKSTTLESEWSFNFLIKHLRNLKIGEIQILNKNIINSSDAIIFCQKKEFLNPILQQYIEEKLNVHIDGQNSKLSLSKSCQLKLKPFFTDFMLTGPRQKRLDAFMFLEENKLISSNERELFYVSYVLENAEIGETLNLAWNFIQSLSENYNKRKEILNEISKQSKLPGQTIFRTPNYEKHTAIISLMNKSFPEYIDLYADTCLKSLKGELLPPKVSSCHEFFSYKNLDTKWKNSYLELKRKIEGSKTINQL